MAIEFSHRWTSPRSFVCESGAILKSYLIFRLIWDYTVCLSPINGTLVKQSAMRWTMSNIYYPVMK